MKNRTKFLTIVAIICVSLSSCKPSFVCPGIDLSLLDRKDISFRLNDSIYYSSNTNDTLLFIVVDFNVEEPILLKGEKECYYSASYTTNEINGISISESSLFWTVSFGNDKEYDFPWWTGIVENDNKCQYTENKEFDGVIYSFVFEAEDLSGNRRIDRFVKVANHGIIEFHDKVTGLTWTQVIPNST